MAVFHQASKTQITLALFNLNYEQQRSYWKTNIAELQSVTILSFLRAMSDYLIWFFNTLFLVSSTIPSTWPCIYF